MKVFYLDSFLLLNLVLDYLLLLLTANLAGVFAKRAALLSAAILGAVFAVWMFFYSGGPVISLLLNCAVGWVMISLSFSAISTKKRVRLYGVFLIQAFGFSGLMSLLQTMGMGRIAVQNGVAYIQIELWQIMLSALGAYVIFRLCFRDHSLKIEKQRVLIQVEIGSRNLQTLVLKDSGNLLREPLSGKPVVLLAPEIIGNVLPETVKIMLQQEDWSIETVMEMLAKESIVARLIPFSTMGEKQGLTVAVKPDAITVGKGDRMKRTANYWVGIARNDIDVCGGCRGVIGV